MLDESGSDLRRENPALGILRRVHRRALLLIALILATSAAGAFAATRGSRQRAVDVKALPVPAAVRASSVYRDCSKVDAVAYFQDNPCQTFVLLTSEHSRSALAFWNAETRYIRGVGWRHSAAQLVDYDGADSGLATRGESWVSPDGRACAYIATLKTGVSAERKAVFPYDPYDIPRGVYTFYRTARAAKAAQTLWVRLRPSNRGGHCIG